MIFQAQNPNANTVSLSFTQLGFPLTGFPSVWPKLWPLMYARLKREVTGPWEIASNCPEERFGYPVEPSDEGYGYKHLVVKAREYIELGYIRHPTTAILYTQANPDAEYHYLTPPDPANLPTPDDLPIPDDLDYLLWE